MMKHKILLVFSWLKRAVIALETIAKLLEPISAECRGIQYYREYDRYFGAKSKSHGGRNARRSM